MQIELAKWDIGREADSQSEEEISKDKNLLSSPHRMARILVADRAADETAFRNNDEE